MSEGNASQYDSVGGQNSDDDENQGIILPSGKVSSITRKQNEITKYIESGVKIDVSQLQKLQESHAKRIHNFEVACEDELKKDAAEEEKKELLKYRSKQEKRYLMFKNKLERWLLEEKYKEDDDSDSDKEDDKSSASAESHKSSASRTEELLAAILQNQCSMKLPDNHPDVFTGEDVVEYRTFIISFERLIERKCKNDDDKYYYLLHYTSGEAKQLVASCQSSDAGKAFMQAKKLLERTYGNEHILAQRYLDRLNKWDQIKSEDTKELSKFASFLTTCLNMMEKMTALSQLNSWRDLKEIIAKLPYDLRKSFRSLASKQVDLNKSVDFKLLVNFVNNHARERSIPLLGEICDLKPRKETYKKAENTKSKTFYVDKDDEVPSCECCKKSNHVLDECRFFLQKSSNERDDFVKSKRLCFGCLKEGHRSKFCKQKLQCKVCNKMHPSSLHKEYKGENKSSDNGKTQNDQQINMTTKNGFKIACPAIPVLIRNKVNGKTISTYAALDNHSTSSYMDRNLLNALDLKGTESTMSIKTMNNHATNIKVSVIKSIELLSLDETESVILQKVFAKSEWPFTFEDSPKHRDLKGLKFHKDIPINFISEKIGILVGMDSPELLRPLEIVEGPRKGPYLSKHKLGWALNGPIKGSDPKLQCFRTANISDNEQMMQKFNDVFDGDFIDCGEHSRYSREEKDWLHYAEKNTKKIDNKLEISLPFKDNVCNLGNNYYQVQKRFGSLTRQLQNNESLCQEYCDFMQLMLENDFMEEVPPSDDAANGNYWYVAHHPVRHKQKDKLRIVFDCSLKYKGVSINDVLRKGPDLANTLAGVLLRFRSEQIAVTADIAKMFYMVKLPQNDRNYFRFFWHKNNDLTKPPSIYRMTAHIFGATSSPAVANFALKKSVQENCPEEVKHVVENAFYVDDMITSFPDEQTAMNVIKRVEESLSQSGFNLTSYSSNSKEVLNSIPNEKLSKSKQNVDVNEQDLTNERPLGIKWDTDMDVIGYNVKLPDQPSTKRGILATMHSIFDPLFIVTPCLIRAKRLFQICCSLQLEWDEPLPQQYDIIWKKWKQQILHLNRYEIPRCYKCTNKPTVSTQLHIFCDGSEIAYGAVAYIRQQNSDGRISSGIVMTKSRLTPINRSSLKTTPRIELNAAKLGAALYVQLSRELKNITFNDGVFFWTDSTAVLKYLGSSSGHFQVYVANRVAYILSTTSLEQWRKVPGKLNPADTLSRGVGSVEDFLSDVLWKKGPAFLMEGEENWPKTGEIPPISLDEPELKKKAISLTTKINLNDDPINQLLESTSCFHKLVCRISALLRLKNVLRKTEYHKGSIKIQELDIAKKEIFKQVQKIYFNEIINDIKQGKPISRKHNLHKLNLYLDGDGLLRIGGRLTHASLEYETKHPILLHGDAYPVKLLVSQLHKDLGHSGREAVLTQVKTKYHILKANTIIRRIIRACIVCRKVQGKPNTQLMADLPSDRVKGDDPPFTHTGTDLFGPFYVSKGRGDKQEKRYGVMFTCLVSRAVHLEITPGLDTDSYINALRRFICRRGTPLLIRSDNGTNLTSTDKELKILLKNLDANVIENFCSVKQIEWKFQPPNASNFGGVFERMIRTFRKIFTALTFEFKNNVKINDDLLATLFLEVENIMNSRPLTTITSDNEDQIPLTANDLLRLNAISVFPIGHFQASEGYIKRKWRQAQFLADVFWRRFKREYLTQLQQRQKWTQEKRSLVPGDIVFVVDNSLPRNEWNVSRVSNIHKSSDGKVRSCDVTMLKNKFKDSDKILLTRPVNKLILLLENIN